MLGPSLKINAMQLRTNVHFLVFAILCIVVGCTRRGLSTPKDPHNFAVSKGKLGDPGWDEKSLQDAKEFKEDYPKDDDPPWASLAGKVKEAKEQLEEVQTRFFKASKKLDVEKEELEQQKKEKKEADKRLKMAEEDLAKTKQTEEEANEAAAKERKDREVSAAKVAEEQKELDEAQMDVEEAIDEVYAAQSKVDEHGTWHNKTKLWVEERQFEHRAAQQREAEAEEELEKAKENLRRAKEALRKAEGKEGEGKPAERAGASPGLGWLPLLLPLVYMFILSI